MTKTLRTQEDVKKTRRELFDRQKGVDPILDEKIDYSDSVLDHDHVSQHCRAALHRQSNAFEGLVFNAYKRCLGWLTEDKLPDILRRLAQYLEVDHSQNPYHPGWMKKVKTRFNKLNADNQRKFLSSFGCELGSNGKDRSASFTSLIKNKDHSYDLINQRLSEYE